MLRFGCPSASHDHTRAVNRRHSQLNHCLCSPTRLNNSVRHTLRRTAATQLSDSTSSSLDASVASTLESSVDEATKTSTADALRSFNIKEVTPEQLFDADHVERWSPQLLAYFPLGCLLAAFRFSAWIAGIAMDASWFRNKAVIDAYMALLGVKVTWRNTQNIPQDQRHVLVSNHISVGDLLVLFQQPQRYVHLITNALPEPVYATQHLPAILMPANKETYLAIAAAQQLKQVQTEAQQQQEQQQLLQHHDANQQQQHQIAVGQAVSGVNSSSREQQQATSRQSAAAAALAAASACRAAISAVQDAPVHVFPEGGMTNGAGMMRFSRGFMLFAEHMPVVPVALRVKTAFPEVKCHTLTSAFLANLFWFSFQPWTEFEAVALPPMQMQPGESKAAYVQRVQLAIAQELGVWVTDMNIQQKRARVQKQQRRQQQLKARR